MWISRSRLAGLERERDGWQTRYEALRVQANQALRAAKEQVRQADARSASMAEKLVTLANRPVQVIQPPDTAAIIEQTITGMATVLNGWKDQPQAIPTVQQGISMDTLGLDDRAGVPQSLDDFVPPWEEGMPAPTHGGYANGRIGNYTPYKPGEGNTTPPKGGME